MSSASTKAWSAYLIGDGEIGPATLHLVRNARGQMMQNTTYTVQRFHSRWRCGIFQDTARVSTRGSSPTYRPPNFTSSGLHRFKHPKLEEGVRDTALGISIVATWYTHLELLHTDSFHKNMSTELVVGNGNNIGSGVS